MTRSIFKQSLTGLNSEFSFSYTSCLTKAEEPSLPYYLPIAGGRIIGFIPFPRVLVLCEMQSVLSKEVSSTIFKVFGMTWPGIEPKSPGPLANALPIRPKRAKDYSYKERLENGTLAQRLECSPMARETWVQSQVESYQRL